MSQYVCCRDPHVSIDRASQQALPRATYDLPWIGIFVDHAEYSALQRVAQQAGTTLLPLAHLYAVYVAHTPDDCPADPLVTLAGVRAALKRGDARAAPVQQILFGLETHHDP